ncbi:unnamed protein product, partial [Anisakis simplex]|uniref:Ras-GEF domain-containing protein n=1 Tax=Anisakis simplex TaxID=6269 RepID=A0A0M3KKB2_ANISI
KSTTTTPTTTTAATTTTTTAIDRCNTVGEQVKSTKGERSPLYEAIWRAGVETSWFHLLRKLILEALANRIHIALEHAPQPQSSSQLVKAANDVLVAWINIDPYLKEYLVSIPIGKWGTVCDFLHCVSATYPCTTTPSTTTTPSSRCQTVSDTIETVGQSSPLNTAIADG